MALEIRPFADAAPISLSSQPHTESGHPSAQQAGTTRNISQLRKPLVPSISFAGHTPCIHWRALCLPVRLCSPYGTRTCSGQLAHTYSSCDSSGTGTSPEHMGPLAGVCQGHDSPHSCAAAAAQPGEYDSKLLGAQLWWLCPAVDSEQQRVRSERRALTES